MRFFWVVIQNGRMYGRVLCDDETTKSGCVQVKGIKNTSSFLVSRGIKGPCWLDVDECVAVEGHRCAVHVVVANPTGISMARHQRPDPPLSTVAMYVHTRMLTGDPMRISAVFISHQKHDGSHTSYVYETDIDEDDSGVVRDTCSRLASLDYDVLIGHGLERRVRSILVERANVCGVKDTGLGWERGERARGRLLCDVATTSALFGKRRDLSVDGMLFGYGAAKLVDVCDTLTTIVGDTDTLGLTLELARVCGCPWQVCLDGRSIARTEYLLKHAFHSRNIPVPTTRPPYQKLEGGRVLVPTTGRYTERVHVIDYASMYPSVVAEYRIPLEAEGDTHCMSDEMCRLMEMRLCAKRDAKDATEPVQKARLQLRQLALKLVCNSFYGSIGSVHCVFYDPVAAAAITAHGRRLLDELVATSKEAGAQVVYGDTDSVFVLGDHGTVRQIIDRTNAKYRHISVGIDGVFMRMLVVGAKAYAGISEDGNSVFKSIGVGDRTRCAFASSVLKACAMVLMTAQTPEVGLVAADAILGRKRRELLDRHIPNTDLVILAKLSKDVAKYDVPLPHVRVAHDMIEHKRMVGRGDMIPYIVCGDGPKWAAADAYNRVPDTHYYINTQIVPALKRIAVCVGGAVGIERLDKTGGVRSGMLRKRQRELCQRLVVSCTTCNKSFAFEGTSALVACPTPECKGIVGDDLQVSVANIKRFVTEYVDAIPTRSEDELAYVQSVFFTVPESRLDPKQREFMNTMYDATRKYVYDTTRLVFLPPGRLT